MKKLFVVLLYGLFFMFSIENVKAMKDLEGSQLLFRNYPMSDSKFIASLHIVFESNGPQLSIPLITNQIEDHMLKYFRVSNFSIEFLKLKSEARSELYELYVKSENGKSQLIRKIDKDLFLSVATKYMHNMKREIDDIRNCEIDSDSSFGSDVSDL